MDRPSEPDELDGPTPPGEEGSEDEVAEAAEDLDEAIADDDEASALLAGLAVAVEDGRVSYDLSGWSSQSRRLLASLITTSEVPHSWLGAVLEVPTEERERTEELLEEVHATELVGLDPDRPKVVYEVGGWSSALQSTLADALGEADIPYEWDADGDLVVYEDDDAAVEEIFDALPDDQAPSEDEGTAAQDVLTVLFVAASQLAKRPRDASAVVSVADATGRLDRLGLPFGFEPPAWDSLVTAASSLLELLEGDAAVPDEEVAAAAAALRDRVRHYV